MSAICDKCKVVLSLPLGASFILIGRRVDLCLTCAQTLFDSIFEDDKNAKI